MFSFIVHSSLHTKFALNLIELGRKFFLIWDYLLTKFSTVHHLTIIIWELNINLLTDCIKRFIKGFSIETENSMLCLDAIKGFKTSKAGVNYKSIKNNVEPMKTVWSFLLWIKSSVSSQAIFNEMKPTMFELLNGQRFINSFISNKSCN